MKTARRLGLTGTVILFSVLMGLISLFPVDGTPFVSAQSQSGDATLSGLTLSDVDFGTFASATTSYTASVYMRVSETTVTPTVNHSGASYVIKLGGVEDSDGTVSLSVGSNVITVTVTRSANTPATGTPYIGSTYTNAIVETGFAFSENV